MLEKFKPEFLTDKSRLQEIFEFRVSAYENSPYSEVVNKRLFPNGWFDEVDNKSFHWILADSQNKLIASARLTYFDYTDELKSIGIDLSNFDLNISKPFGLISRLVVDKSFRGQGISKCFDKVRIEKMEKDKIEICFGEAREERIKSLERFNFKIIGNLDFKANPHGAEEYLTLMMLESKLH